MRKMALFTVAVIFLLFGACAPVTPVPPPVTPVPPPPTVEPPTPSGDAQFLPDKVLTPGATNPNVSQQTIDQTICVPGYSSSIRPPVSYTDALKITQIKQYGYQDTNTANYEEDHFIPLSVGGNPTDPHNLWPQPRNTQPYNAGVKDTLEYTLYKMVCDRQLDLSVAQQAIVSDWVQAYRTYVTPVLGILPNFNLSPEP